MMISLASGQARQAVSVSQTNRISHTWEARCGGRRRVCLHRLWGCIDFCARTPCDVGSLLKLYKYGPLASAIYPSLHSSFSVLHQHTCLILRPVSLHLWVTDIDFYLRSWPKNELAAWAPPAHSTDWWLPAHFFLNLNGKSVYLKVYLLCRSSVKR